MPKLKLFARLVFGVIISILLLTRSNMLLSDRFEQVRAFTRNIEFDYVSWTLDALGLKAMQAALGAEQYMPPAAQKKIIRDYLTVLNDVLRTEARLTELYSDPKADKEGALAISYRQQLKNLHDYYDLIAPLAESILQEQVSSVLADLNLTFIGQPVPPVLYHTSPLPLDLIVSPRNIIRQEADVSLLPDMTVAEKDALENQIDRALNVSSLVVPVGGIGIYPTMVMRSTDLDWVIEVISHEWTHNFLTLRPLGMSYYNSAQLRTMNETTANIAGKEIGLEVIKRYYPELIPAPAPEQTTSPASQPAQTPPAEEAVFDFQVEMHKTRVTVDELLAEGKIEEAESYMEERRQFLWENGYHLRKLNQAYFAFYGAYADTPAGSGSAGKDPVGPAVQTLRQRSASLADFLNRISWMSSFEQLQSAVQ
jgi:hypothetical protein